MAENTKTYASADYVPPHNEGVIVDLSEFAERIVAYDDSLLT